MQTDASTVYQRHRWTVEEYHRLGEVGIFREDDRVELIEGEIIEMPPIGSKHADCVDRLAAQLIKSVGDQHRVRVQNPLQLGQYGEPEPDIAIVKNKNYFEAHPDAPDVLLIIEVADTTLRYDWDIKVPLYARHGIPEVWIIDLEDQRLHLFCKPSISSYQEMVTFEQPSMMAPVQLPECKVDLTGLFGGSSG
ncbi:MAG: Uma2 family endonuclease [Nitrososphaera sp.]